MIKKKPSRNLVFFPSSNFCPGCGHGIVNRLIGEVMDEQGLGDKAICAQAVGCSCLNLIMTSVDSIQSPHGRAGAVATGIKRVRPESFVYTYQGDGDAAAIGLSETLYAAQRDENITVFFINNGVFGMTGGQMAPTTLEGQVTTTSKNGRDTSLTGESVRVAELINQFNVSYIARGSLHNAKEINKTKKYIQKAVANQMDKKGYSFVEILAPCPTNWKMKPVSSMEHIEENVVPYYPLGVLKDREVEK